MNAYGYRWLRRGATSTSRTLQLTTPVLYFILATTVPVGRLHTGIYTCERSEYFESGQTAGLRVKKSVSRHMPEARHRDAGTKLWDFALGNSKISSPSTRGYRCVMPK